MFKLNRMTDYAIVVLGALAHRHGEILATAQLAELTGLNQPTVAKVAKTLVAADLLNTQRGVRGGYRLAREASIISLVQIVEAMEGPIAVDDRADGLEGPYMVSSCCSANQNWNRVNQVVRNALNDVSLEDLMYVEKGFASAGQLQVKDQEVPAALTQEVLL